MIVEAKSFDVFMLDNGNSMLIIFDVALQSAGKIFWTSFRAPTEPPDI